ncbi:MAG: hypothetical protein V1747_05950 [Candidatus Omnitrophota bacterium]
MNLSDIHKLSSKEIVQSIARMLDSPMEKAMRAELDVRLIESVTDLSANIYSLRLSLDNIAKANKSKKMWLIFISVLLVVLTGVLFYYIFKLNLPLLQPRA